MAGADPNSSPGKSSGQGTNSQGQQPKPGAPVKLPALVNTNRDIIRNNSTVADDAATMRYNNASPHPDSNQVEMQRMYAQGAPRGGNNEARLSEDGVVRDRIEEIVRQ